MKYLTLNILIIVSSEFSVQQINFISAWEQFLSDVGGAAGLVLGISLATIFGVFDCSTIILMNCCRIICRHLVHSISDKTHFMIQRLASKISNNQWNTERCLLSREKAVKDVNSRVEFCLLVGVILNLDWSIFSWPVQIENNPD